MHIKTKSDKCPRQICYVDTGLKASNCRCGTYTYEFAERNERQHVAVYLAHWTRTWSAPSESHISLIRETHHRMEVKSSATKAHVALVGGGHLVWSTSSEPHVTFVDVVVIIVRDKCWRSPSEIDVSNCLRRPDLPFCVIEQLIACNNVASGSNFTQRNEYANDNLQSYHRYYEHGCRRFYNGILYNIR